MSVLLSAVFKKKFANFGFDVVNLIMGFDTAETYMRVSKPYADIHTQMAR